MKRRIRRNRWDINVARPRKRGGRPVYPLPHVQGRRPAQPARPRRMLRFRRGGQGADEPQTAAFVVVPEPRAARPRGVRWIAWLIIALLPLALGAWVLSVVVPIAIEARQASQKIFMTPVQRAHFDTPIATPPVVPGDTPVATSTATTAAATVTTGPSPSPSPTHPGAPTATSAPPTATPFPAWDGDQPVTIMLLGVDSREGETDPPRSDTVIVVRVDPVAKRVDMLSIPRDLLVEIPGYYATKINAAYPFGELNDSIPGGGPTLAAQTIELNFGIRIDYFAEIDIAGLEKVIDTLGGVMIDVPGILKDDQYPTGNYGYTRVYFSPGWQWMNGQTAVRYSRTRHDDGDFNRTRRQQQVLLAMRDRVLATGLLSKLPQLISDIGDAVRTDLSPRQVLSLARLGQEIDQSNIYSHSLFNLVEAQDINGGFYFVGDWEAIRALAQNMPADTDARRATDPMTAPLYTPTATPGATPTPRATP